MTRPGIDERGYRSGFALGARLLCAAAAVAVAMLLAAFPALAATTETVTFTSTGETAVVVPPNVTSLDVVAVGGSGGSGGIGGVIAGGQGAQVTGTIAVTPGQTVYLEVGGDGTTGEGYGGDGGGGGESDVRTAPESAGLSPDPRLIVAGGGGGSGDGGVGGYDNTYPGVGGNGGRPGIDPVGACTTGLSGGAGTQTSGGAAGINSGQDTFGALPSISPALPGSLGSGGQGSDLVTTPSPPNYEGPAPGGYNGGAAGGGYGDAEYLYAGGGGGGGGYYGGGGGGGVTTAIYGDNFCDGMGGGGGGGSNLVPAGGSATIPAAGTAPSITVSFTDSTLPLVSLTPLPAVTTGEPDGYQLALTGACDTVLGDSGTVSVSLYSGASVAGTLLETGGAQCESGAWSTTLSTDALPNGQYTAQASQTDEAGNVGESAASTFTLDQTLPALSLSTPALSSSTPAWVKATPTFAGAAGTAPDDDSTVSVTIAPAAGGAAVQTLTAPVNPSTGAWSVTASPLADGNYVAQVSQEDNVGNVSTVAGQLDVKTTLPALTLACSALATPACDGLADTADGDLPDVTVAFYAGATVSGTPVATLQSSIDQIGFYEVTVSAPLPDGTYTVQAVQSDKAGNMGNATVTFTIDTTPLTLDPIDGHGSLPTFTGVCSVGLLYDGTAMVNVYAGDTTTGTPIQTINVTCGPSTGAFTAPALSALAAGTYTAEAIQSDALGGTITSVQGFTVSSASAISASVTLPVISGSDASVSVACGAAGACNVVATLSVVETLQGGKLIAVAATAKKIKKTLILGSKSETVPAGKTAKITVALNATGRRLLAARHRLRVRLVETLAGHQLGAATLVFKTKIRR